MSLGDMDENHPMYGRASCSPKQGYISKIVLQLHQFRTPSCFPTGVEAPV